MVCESPNVLPISRVDWWLPQKAFFTPAQLIALPGAGVLPALVLGAVLGFLRLPVSMSTE
jgi:hypothetical protein